MAQPRKPANKKPAKKDTPLDSQKAKVAEQEANVRAKLEQCQRLIDEAPMKKQERQRKEREELAERQRREREELVARASRAPARTHSRATLPDLRHYYLDVGVASKRKKLRAERNRGRFLSFLLLVIFAVVATWFYLTFNP